MALSPAERIRLGLDDAPPGGEFVQTHVEYAQAPATAGMPVNAAPRNLRLVLQEGEKATAPKIRQMVNELLAGNIEHADLALKQLFAVNPKLGLECYIELAQFSLPKLKAVAVQVDDRSDNPRALSTAQLMQALQGD